MNSDRNRGGSSNDSLRGAGVERAKRVSEWDETWPSAEPQAEPQGDGEPYTGTGRSGGGYGENNYKEKDSPQGRPAPSTPAQRAKAVPEKSRSSRRSP